MLFDTEHTIPYNNIKIELNNIQHFVETKLIDQNHSFIHSYKTVSYNDHKSLNPSQYTYITAT
jgi:hypothetical protein